MKASALILFLILVAGCVTQPGKLSLVGTWKVKEADSYVRFYADGRAAKWPEGSEKVTVWATYHDGTITFHDWDANLIRRDSALILQSEFGDEVFYRAPRDVEPPPRPNQATMQPTAGRRTNKLSMTPTSPPAAARALASGG